MWEAASSDAAPAMQEPAAREAMRERFENASPEEREKMMEQFRKRFENMSPEERERMQERFRQHEGGAMGQGFPPGPPPGGGDRGDRGRGGGMRQRMMNATPEERERMRKQFEERFKNMSPEEQEQMKKRFGQRRQESAESEQ